MRLPWWFRWQSISLQCWRPGFVPWVRKIPWKRKWQPTPLLLPGKSHGWKSLVVYSPWGSKESDMTERLHFHFRWGILHRVLLVIGWCWVLYSSGFICVSSHYLMRPRVNSLVVLESVLPLQMLRAWSLDHLHRSFLFEFKWQRSHHILFLMILHWSCQAPSTFTLGAQDCLSTRESCLPESHGRFFATPWL